MHMKPVTFRPTELLYAEIVKRAQLDRRSVNATVCLLVESALGYPTQAVERAQSRQGDDTLKSKVLSTKPRATGRTASRGASPSPASTHPSKKDSYLGGLKP